MLMEETALLDGAAEVLGVHEDKIHGEKFVLHALAQMGDEWCDNEQWVSLLCGGNEVRGGAPLQC